MSKIIRLCVFIIFIVVITTTKSFPYVSKDENQDKILYNDAEKLAKCFDEKIELKITFLERTTQTLENLIFKYLTNDNKSKNEVISTENINDYIKFERQELKELKDYVKNLNFHYELFTKYILSIVDEAFYNQFVKLAENITNLYETQKSELKNFLNEKLASKEVKQLQTRDYDKNLNCLNKCNSTDELPETCAEATLRNKLRDNTYALHIHNSSLKPFYAFCTHENENGRAWTIIQRREDGSENFNRNWTDYKEGFGDPFAEYWIGLERLHIMTKDRHQELWILLMDYNGEQRWAKYSKFSIASENEDYKLTLEGYEGTAGDAFIFHNNARFATYDRDTSESCATTFQSGWWYNDCYRCNLNGIFRSFSNRNIRKAIKWLPWHKQSLKYTHMAIRTHNIKNILKKICIH